MEQPNSTVLKSKEYQNRIIKHSASACSCIKLELATGCVLDSAVCLAETGVCLSVCTQVKWGVLMCAVIMLL